MKAGDLITILIGKRRKWEMSRNEGITPLFIPILKLRGQGDRMRCHGFVLSELEVLGRDKGEDVEIFKAMKMYQGGFYPNPLVDDEESISLKIDQYYFNAESNLIESLLNRNTLIDSSPKFEYLLEEFSEELNADIADTILKSLSLSPIPIEDSDSHIEEIDLFLDTDDLMPSGIDYDDYDSEGDIQFLEELLSKDPLLLPKNESSNVDHHDDPSFPHPPLKPPDVEMLFDLEPDTVDLTAKVMEDSSEHHVLMPKVLPTQPTLCLNIDPLLLFSPENKDKVFKPCILSYLLVSH
nr:hypothetical protein [Tanacetum cinerariifolium]